VRRSTKSFIITLTRDQKRVCHVKNNVQQKIDGAEIFQAVDGIDRIYLEECLCNYGILLEETYARICTVGQLGCACSHIQLWHRFAQLDQRLFLVLEDDVLLVDNFQSKLNNLIIASSKITFDLLYLFHHADCRPSDFDLSSCTAAHSVRICSGFPTWGTVAYVITSRGAGILLSHLTNTTHDRPIDEMIMRLVRENLLSTFIAIPSLVSTAGTLNPVLPPAALGSNVWNSPKFL